jgi:hypothetical protein
MHKLGIQYFFVIVLCDTCMLKVYKLDDLSLNWFKSYLSERSQKVIINNYESSAQNISFVYK